MNRKRTVIEAAIAGALAVTSAHAQKHERHRKDAHWQAEV